MGDAIHDRQARGQIQMPRPSETVTGPPRRDVTMSIARRRILIYTNATICEGLEVELQDVKLQGVVSEVPWAFACIWSVVDVFLLNIRKDMVQVQHSNRGLRIEKGRCIMSSHEFWFGPRPS